MAKLLTPPHFNSIAKLLMVKCKTKVHWLDGQNGDIDDSNKTAI